MNGWWKKSGKIINCAFAYHRITANEILYGKDYDYSYDAEDELMQQGWLKVAIWCPCDICYLHYRKMPTKAQIAKLEILMKECSEYGFNEIDVNGIPAKPSDLSKDLIKQALQLVRK